MPELLDALIGATAIFGACCLVAEAFKERTKTDTHIHLTVTQEDWSWPPRGKTRVGIDKEEA